MKIEIIEKNTKDVILDKKQVKAVLSDLGIDLNGYVVDNIWMEKERLHVFFKQG